MFLCEGFQKLHKHNMSAFPPNEHCVDPALTTCNLSCQNSFSFALSRKGNSRTWCTKIYLKIGRSESRGLTSPNSDLNGAPNLCSAVGELSSVISNLTC